MDGASPQFLDLKNYRRKRLMDAARLFPAIGVFVLVFPLPLLFGRTETEEQTALPLALYLFIVWMILILGAAFLSRKMRDPATER
jgi:uncharacterized membrane protein